VALLPQLGYDSAIFGVQVQDRTPVHQTNEGAHTTVIQSADIPAPPPALRQRIAALERAVAADPASDLFLELARTLIEGRQYKRATLILRAGLRTRADHLPGTLLLGEALLARGKRKSATRELARLLSRHPSSVPAMVLLGRSLIEGMKLDEALIILQRARQTAPNDGTVIDLLDRVHGLRRGRERSVVLQAPSRKVPRKPAFTGYIQHAAEGPVDDPSVLIDASYKAELSENDLEETSGADSLRDHLEDTGHLPIDQDVTFQEGLVQQHPYSAMGTASLEEDEDDRTRPMSTPPSHMQWARISPAMGRRAPAQPARSPAGPTQDMPMVDPEQVKPRSIPVSIPASIPANAPTAELDLDDEEPTVVGVDGPVHQRTHEHAVASDPGLNLPPTRSFQVSGSSAGSDDDWLGDDPTEALAQGGADGAPHTDEEDPDIISSARPIDRRRAIRAPHSPVIHVRAPGAQPPKPPARQAPLDPVNLLDIPMQPDDFDDMPPKPAPVATHALPADLLDSRQQKALRVPAVRRGPVPPKRPAKSRGPVPPKRPAPSRGPVPPKRPAKSRGPVPAKRPPAPPQGQRGPVPSKRPPAQRPAAQPPKRGPARAPGAPKTPDPTPPPNYQGGAFASYYDARGAQRPDETDHLAALVGEQLEASPAQSPAPQAAAPRRKQPVLRASLAMLAVLVVLSGVMAWRYIGAVDTYTLRISKTHAALQHGGFAARIDAAQMLQSAQSPAGPIARAANALLGFAGHGQLTALAQREQALLARVQAERVAQFGERALLAEAEGTVAQARAAGPIPDARIADALIHWVKGTPDTGLKALLAGRDADTAAVAYVAARLHHAAGRAVRAQDFARRAVQLDDQAADAHKLLADLKALRGDNSGALQDYDHILETIDSAHADTRIERERLRITVNKRPRDAMLALRSLIDGSAQPLAPNQIARIHDSIGLYHIHNNALPAARAAYRAAMEAAPGDPRYATGLARLDLREFKLDAAETVLNQAARSEPNAQLYRTLLARAALLRGQPSAALRELGAVSTPNAEALLLKGIALLDLDQPRSAEQALNDAARADAGLRDTRLYRQLAVFRQGRQTKLVLEDLRSARSRSTQPGQRLDDRALPFRVYAEALARSKQPKSADRSYMLAIDEAPRDFRSHYGRCQVAAQRLRARDALKHCRAALAVNPHYLPAAIFGATIAEADLNTSSVISMLAPLSARLAPPEVQRLARAYVAQGEHVRAGALAKHPALSNVAHARYIEAITAAGQGKLSQAEALLTPITEQLNDDPWVQLAYAELLLKLGSATKALVFYRRASKLNKSPRASLGAAWSALRTNDTKTALREARYAEKAAGRGLAHPRLRAEALSVQGHAVLQGSGRGGFRRAGRLFGKALRIEPDLPSALLGQGQLAEAQGRLDVAVSRYYRVTEVAPRKAEAHYRQGRLLLTSGTPSSHQRGRADLQRAQRLDPQGQWGIRAAKLLAQPR
jgi:predicted Zn-dependent protease